MKQYGNILRRNFSKFNNSNHNSTPPLKRRVSESVRVGNGTVRATSMSGSADSRPRMESSDTVASFRSLKEFVKTRHHVEHGRRRQSFFSNGLNLQGKLGGGAFGQVYLAEDIATGLLKAVKGIDVKKVNKQGDEVTWLTKEERRQAHEECRNMLDRILLLPEGVVKHHYLEANTLLQEKLRKEEDPQIRKFRRPVTEHEILRRLSPHPFISTVENSFRDGHKLYLVFQYYQGGTLKRMLQSQPGGVFTEDQARFYVAEIILGLLFLQENNVAHRDIKPENIILDRHGHIVISDFGLATRLKGGLKTLCGTAEYVAPEVLSSKTWKSFYLDWWALGITMYEMLVGKTPFVGEDAQTVFVNILTAPIVIPSHISPQAKDLILKLLSRDYSKRIMPDDIMDHPFFEGIDRQMLYRKLVQPPLQPQITEPRLKSELTPALRRRPRLEFSLDSS